MVPIGKLPIIHHIMNIYSFTDIKISTCLGYKGDIIKKYFNKKINDWNLNLIDTGPNTLTGGRVRLEKFLKNETFS